MKLPTNAPVPDPLTNDQKDALHNFVSKRIRPKLMLSSTRGLAFTYDKKEWDCVNVYEKSKEALGPKNYGELRKAVIDPGVVPGLKLATPQQTFAARKYLQGIIRSSHDGSFFTETADRQVVDEKYQKKLAGQGKRSLAVQQLLSANEPVKPMPVGVLGSASDQVLANTHVERPGSPNMQAWHARHVAAIQSEVERMSAHPELKHVFDALATLARKEKVNVFFSNTPRNVNRLLGRDEASAPVGGIYDKGHTVHNSALLEFDGALRPRGSGTLVHEASHMLFDRIVGEGADPCATSALRQELDAALVADRQHRSQRYRGNDSQHQKMVGGMLDFLLQNHPGYFPDGYNSKNDMNRLVLRREAIVRPMQMIAEGVSRADVETMAPNLMKYYDGNARALLEAYTRENAVP